MTKGDIVLVPFPFTDLSGVKNRPALVLLAGELDITVAFVTTQLKWQENHDVLIAPAHLNRLKRESLVRLSKLTTIDRDLVIGRLGRLTSAEVMKVNEAMISLFRLRQ
jgi:mRNA interferase MazF